MGQDKCRAQEDETWRKVTGNERGATARDGILRDKGEGERAESETDSNCDCCWTQQPYRPSRTSPPNASLVKTTLGSQRDPLGAPGKQIATDIGEQCWHLYKHTHMRTHTHSSYSSRTLCSRSKHVWASCCVAMAECAPLSTWVTACFQTPLQTAWAQVPSKN